jgi:hypothetical protein
MPAKVSRVNGRLAICVEIRDRRNRRIVTVVELLSPANKTPGADRDAYLGKRGEILAGQTNLVEIDLRRGGKRPHPPDLPPCDYYALVSRYEDRPNVGFWPIALRERLPIVQVPLAAPDPDAHLDLQSVLDRTYDAAGFGSYIYSETPEPALAPDDAAWAATFCQCGIEHPEHTLALSEVAFLTPFSLRAVEMPSRALASRRKIRHSKHLRRSLDPRKILGPKPSTAKAQRAAPMPVANARRAAPMTIAGPAR